MKYLRDVKGIDIKGSSQKNKLMNIGYYHGYKGYRFIRNANDKITYSNFNEVTAIYDFDSSLKQIFYPCVMELETAFKNRTLAIILDESNTSDLTEIYNDLLTEYVEYINSKDRNDALKRRLALRNKLFSEQSNAFTKHNPIATHYLNKRSNLPIWGLFELLSLGEFAKFVSCLKESTRLKISDNLQLPKTFDQNGKLFEKMLEVDRNLRNAVAHNDVVFDTRFGNKNASSQLRGMLSNQTKINNITFDTVADYIIFMVYQLKLIGKPKTELKKIVSDFETATNKLRNCIPNNVYAKILHSDCHSKMIDLRKYISK